MDATAEDDIDVTADRASADGEGDGDGFLNVELTDEATEAALRRVRFVSHALDNAIRIPGTKRRVGIDPVLSILPVGGDAAGLVLSLYPIAEAARLGVPTRVLARMLLNVGLDAVVGSIPVLGTLFDAFWKANERNVDLLERHLA